jgi:NAD(P) transhydrogenase
VPKSYDLIVLGGGPAGITGARTAADFGKRVALIDSHHELGGAGVNTGTVPSKTLRETALALSGMRSRNLYGVDLSLRREATVGDFLRHERDVKAGINAALAHQIEAAKIDQYDTAGSFAGPKLIRAGDALLESDRILIATGSSPFHPALFPFDAPEVYDSDTVLELDRLPKTMAIVGAGTIGCEYACTFAALGTKIHLIDGGDVLLPFLDSELSLALANAMEKDGIVFHRKQRVEHCDPSLTVTLTSGEVLHVDAVLVAAGRTANTVSLNLAAAGVATGDRNLILVDEFHRTNVEGIYAAGDVTGFPALASTGMQQARLAVRHAFEVSLPRQAATILPSGIYTIPEIGAIGETEESLRRAGVDYIVGRGPYASNARGRIIGDDAGFLKLLFRRSDLKLLGVHAIGEQATELVHIGMMALLAGSTAGVFDEACFNIPTLGGLYKYAALEAMSAARHSAAAST